MIAGKSHRGMLCFNSRREYAATIGLLHCWGKLLNGYVDKEMSLDSLVVGRIFFFNLFGGGYQLLV